MKWMWSAVLHEDSEIYRIGGVIEFARFQLNMLRYMVASNKSIHLKKNTAVNRKFHKG